MWIFKNQRQHDQAHKYDEMRFGKKASYQGFKKSKKRKSYKEFYNEEESGCLVTMVVLLGVASVLAILVL